MSDPICELCASTDTLNAFEVEASRSPETISICENCRKNISFVKDHIDHWRCLTTSMWSESLAVKVISYRLLKQLSTESWAQEALDMLYMDDDTLAWAEAGVSATNEPTRDSNGTILQAGDTVTVIKDLPVKGAGFTAKRGTAVRGISLTDNPEQIEGKVNGQRIVLVSAFLKKS